MKIALENIDFSYINLNTRPDRREHMEAELSRIGIYARRLIAAGKASILPGFDFKRYSPGAKGCFISHYNYIKTYTGKRIIGVLEDDATFCNDFMERMKYIEKNFKEDWDIFFLSAYYCKEPHWHPETGDFALTDTKYIHRVYGSFCTHAYLVNPRSKDKMLALMRQYFGSSKALDHLFILIQPHLKCFAFTPGMVAQIYDRSDIDTAQHPIENLKYFQKVCGPHIFSKQLTDFDYDTYFEVKKPKPLVIAPQPITVKSPIATPKAEPQTVIASVTIPKTEPVTIKPPVIISPKAEPENVKAPITIPKPEPEIIKQPVIIPKTEPETKKPTVTIPKPEPITIKPPVIISQPGIIKGAIIIPFRDRLPHLQEFIKSKRVIDAKGELKVIVIQQLQGKPFNRGKLLNVGFLLNRDKYPYFIFHDVDMMPTKSTDYSAPKPNTPTHICTQASQFDYKMPSDNYFGGVTIFNASDFEKINGFSNEYWGWGREDDDLYMRCRQAGLKIKRRKCKFESLPHAPSQNHTYLRRNQARLLNMQSKFINFAKEGLNTCDYRVIDKKEFAECTFITVEI